jgi:replicative DNA helicase
MKLSAPLHVLKGKAKALKKSQGLQLSAALDRIAKEEGYASWSLLQAKAKSFTPKTKEDVLDDLHAGDMLLVGARPGLGKTTLALQILLAAAGRGRPCYFYSFEYTAESFAGKMAALGGADMPENLKTDFSEEISSDYIIRTTQETIREGSIVAVDYLQLLDQQRHKPPLQTQIAALKDYARARRCSFLFISQIDRRFDAAGAAVPTRADVRLPNPLDLALFNKAIFVKDGLIYGA